MIAGLKPYSAYKDSGVAWLGKVPAHWDMRRLKYLLKERDTRSVDGGEQLLRVSQYTGVTQRDLTGNGGEPDTRAESLVGYKCVAPEDLVVNIMLAWNGSMGVSQFPGIASPAYCVYRFGENAHPWYFHHLLRSHTYKARIKAVSTGVVESRLRLYTDDLYRLEGLLPPLVEQTAIVGFLGYADRRIRRYIRAKQKLIALLEEQKQAILHQAVTGQIDVRTSQPYPAYKPSGVEWLGDVPAHWDVKKLRQCGTVAGGLTPSMENQRFWDGSIPWVTPKDMKREAICDSSVKVTGDAVRETSLRLIDPPSVLMVVRGMILARRVPIAWTTSPVTINQDMKALSPVLGIKAEFLARALHSAREAFVPLIDEAGHGTRRLPTERWQGVAVAIPPEDEQEAIVDFLRRSTRDVTAAIENVRGFVDRLNEYRTRLIADVVTGKLDVREAAASVPEIDPLAAEDGVDETFTDVSECDGEVEPAEAAD